MIVASCSSGGNCMPYTELPIIYLIATSFLILTLCVLLLAFKVKKLLTSISELKVSLKVVATKDDISLANKKLDTDLVNAMLLLENNMTQRSEELLAEAIELRSALSKLRTSQHNIPVDGLHDFDNKLDAVIAFDLEGLSTKEISSRLNLKHEFVQDIIQFNRQN